MKITHFFVERPIFATVISVLITLVGAIAFGRLPVTQYPEVAPPTIQVTAVYPGASAEIAAQTVAAPLEQEINGVEGMLYVFSQSTASGQVNVTVTFEIGTDIDAAQVLVQNRVARAEPRLPEEVRRLGVTVERASPNIMMVVHLFSPGGELDPLYVSNYAFLNLRDPLARIDGVGNIIVFGASEYAMRVWLDPDQLAARGLTAGDVIAALRGQNVQVASGALNQEPAPGVGGFQLSVRTLGRLTEPEQFDQIIVKTGAEGRVTRLSDVARVELGAYDYSTKSYLDDENATAIGVFQRPGSNALQTADEILTALEELSAGFPEGLEYTVVYNPTEYIEESIFEVYKTMFEATALVVLVVFVFLQSLRASIVPILAIPISLIGSFAVLLALGFSLNNLSLFGLVLAIGIVVDDAIVVVENVERNLRNGMTPKEAARKTMDEVGGALVAIALVLSAVFIPSAFLSSVTGAFYRQFAVTIAVATVISAIVSLTLSPALSSMLLSRNGHLGDKGPWWRLPVDLFFRAFNAVYGGLERGYHAIVRGAVIVVPLMLIVYVGLIGAAAYLFAKTPTGFIPEQDQGYAIIAVQLPPGAALSRTDEAVKRIIAIAEGVDGVEHGVGFAGFSGATFSSASNEGVIFVPFTPYEERIEHGRTANAIIGDLQQRVFAVTDAFAFVVPPPAVQGLGSLGGFKMMVQDRAGHGLEALSQSTYALMGAASQDPSLVGVFTTFETSTPQIYADIDRVRAEQLGVAPTSVFEALEVYLGSVFVNDFNFLGRTYRVTAQADAPFREDVDDVARLRVRNASGDMVPLGSVANMETVTGSSRVPRYNLYPAAELQGNAAPGVSSSEALAHMEALAEQVLPPGFGYEWTELALQQKTAQSPVMIFVLGVVVVLLVLAALYESWSLPFAIILIVPMCLLAALVGVNLRGMDNNILTQIGFLVLVGLAAKNAILIVEFARQNENAGMDLKTAAAEAARLRLRPILMTSFAFILGVVPLVFASGAGSELRQALGTAVFSGMIGVTFFGLIFTPVLYVAVREAIARREPRLVETPAE